MSVPRSARVTAPPPLFATRPGLQPAPETANAADEAEAATDESVGSVAVMADAEPPAMLDGARISVALLRAGRGMTARVPVAVAVPGVVAEFEAVNVYVQLRLSAAAVVGGLMVTVVPRS